MRAKTYRYSEKFCSLRRVAYFLFARLRGSLNTRAELPPSSESRHSRPRLRPFVIQITKRRVTAAYLRSLLVNNPAYAVRWIEAAAKSGLVPAQIVWGQLLLNGHGCLGSDAGAAYSTFESASASGDAEALNMLGRCYEQGWGVKVNTLRAIEFFEVAAKAGHTWAQVNLAQMLMRAGDLADRPRCFALFKVAAEGGTLKANLKAMNSLARFLEEGWTGVPDPAGAVYWYLKAAKLGDHWAQFNLATILFRQGDQECADRWLRSAVAISDNGFRRRIAPLLLARPETALRERGLEALEHCAAGEAPADLYAYAMALEKGVSGSPDPGKAAIFFNAAASKGHLLAKARLKSSPHANRCYRLAAVANDAARVVAATHSIIQSATLHKRII